MTVLADTFSATVLELKAISLGVSFSLVTVTAKAYSKLKPPWSVVLMRTVYLDLVSKSGLAVMRNLLLLMLNDALSVSPDPLTKV